MSSIGRKLLCLESLSAAVLLCVSALKVVHAQETAVPETHATSFTVNYLPYSLFINSIHEGPIIKAKINGRSYWFLCDTGASTSVIKQSVVQEAKLPVEDAPTITEHSNLTTALSFGDRYKGAVASSILVGNAELKDVPFYIAPDTALDSVMNPTVL